MVGEMRAAQRHLTKLLKSVGAPPRVMITDNSPLTFPTGCASWNRKLPSLKSRGAARVKMSLQVEHRQNKGQNHRAENSHQPARRRERLMKRLKSSAPEKRFLSIHNHAASLFHFSTSLMQNIQRPPGAALRKSALLRRGAKFPKHPLPYDIGSAPNRRLPLSEPA